MKINSGPLRIAAALMLVAAGWFVFHNTVVPTVTVVAARKGVARLSATGNVTVLPSQDGRVVSPAQGIITSFKLKEGDRVKAGDIIAEIDRGSYPFLLNDSLTDLKQLDERLAKGSPQDIELDKNKKSYEKNIELAKAGGIPAELLERERRDIEQMEFSIKQERSDLEFKRTKLQNKIAEIRQEIERRTIRAGYDGVIMTPAVLQGDTIFNGGAICNITSLGKILRAVVNQDDLEAVRRSKRVLVRLFSQEDKVFEGKISQVLPIGDSNTQRFTVFIDMPQLPDSILSGQTGEATFIADEHADALLVPRKALLGTECFILNGDRLEKRKVKVGYTNLTDAEILSGLNPGDLVVAKDVDLRRHGEKVTQETAKATK